MHFDVRKAFRQATAVVVLGLVGAGAGGYGYQQTHNRPDAAKTPAETAALAGYVTRLDAIKQAQNNSGATNDEESATRHIKQKIQFRTDVVLDTALNEKDVGALGARFNTLSTDDAVVFSAVDQNPGSVAERNKCLNDISLSKDRAETAERVEECMVVYAQKDKQNAKTAAELGGLFGVALAGSFLLGHRNRKPAI